jgi:hypothetical protein
VIVLNHCLLNRKYILINYLRALASNIRGESGGLFVLSSVILIFQRSHQAAIESRPRWIFHRTLASLRSVAYRLMSSAKRAKFTPKIWGVSLMYKLYRVGDRTEPCCTPACMYLGVEFSPSTETLNFRCERKELISLIEVVENCNLDNL